MSSSRQRGLLRSFGPALVVAAVVLGPGSILTSSRVGAQYGYAMGWVVVFASVLMAGSVALAARLGVCLEGTLCDELARRAGRPVAVVVGCTTFAIVAVFQASNNLAILAALEPLFDGADGGVPVAIHPLVPLCAINTLVVFALFGARALYRPLERLMLGFVLVMAVAFVGNLWFARPSVGSTLAGLLPSWPRDADGFWPIERDGAVDDPLWALQALVATTFSVAGAFYQGYLVRAKGWGVADLRRGLLDSIVGIAVLGGLSFVILIGAAAVLHGRIDPAQLGTTGDVARQLTPLFGARATALFSAGIFAGAFSSFLVNAMIGGLLLADGLGRGGDMDARWPRYSTVGALLLGMGLALVTARVGGLVHAIVFAQAVTVVGVPVLSASLLWLATRRDVRDRVPGWLVGFGVAGLVVAVLSSVRTAWRVWLTAT